MGSCRARSTPRARHSNARARARAQAGRYLHNGLNAAAPHACARHLPRSQRLVPAVLLRRGRRVVVQGPCGARGLRGRAAPRGGRGRGGPPRRLRLPRLPLVSASTTRGTYVRWPSRPSVTRKSTSWSTSSSAPACTPASSSCRAAAPGQARGTRGARVAGAGPGSTWKFQKWALTKLAWPPSDTVMTSRIVGLARGGGGVG